MPLGSETILAGQYTVTWNSVSLGIMEGDANVPTIEHVNKSRAVDNTDAWAKSTIDDVYQGLDMFASMVCMEYKAGPLGAWWPWSTLGLMGVIARLGFDLSQPLVLTAVTGTPAQVAGSPATLTGAHTLLAPGFTTRTMFGPDVRTLPLRFRLYPYDTDMAGAYGWFTTT